MTDFFRITGEIDAFIRIEQMDSLSVERIIFPVDAEFPESETDREGLIQRFPVRIDAVQNTGIEMGIFPVPQKRVAPVLRKRDFLLLSRMQLDRVAFKRCRRAGSPDRCTEPERERLPGTVADRCTDPQRLLPDGREKLRMENGDIGKNSQRDVTPESAPFPALGGARKSNLKRIRLIKMQQRRRQRNCMRVFSLELRNKIPVHEKKTGLRGKRVEMEDEVFRFPCGIQNQFSFPEAVT